MSKGRPSTIPFSGEVASAAPPVRPRWLDKDARKKWEELIRSEDGSTFTTADETLLVSLCVAWARWRKYSVLADKAGDIIETEGGKHFYNLYAAARDKADKIVGLRAKQLNLGNRSKRKAGAVQRVPSRDRSKGPPPPSKTGS